MLFGEVLEMWWYGEQLNLREISIHKKRMTINAHILPYFGSEEIDLIDDLKINQFIYQEKEKGNHITGGPLNPNQIIKEIAIIGTVLEYALQKGYIRQNPMIFIKKIKRVPAQEYEIFTFEEVQKLIQVARPKWLGDMILLAYNTGMRKCECFGLQWEDINFVEKSISINRSVTAAKPGDRFITEPKTILSKRSILLDDETFEMLKRRYNKRTSDFWVFADKYGQLLSPWYNVKYFRAACKKAGIHSKRFYDLRHTHITELVLSGESLAVIQKRVGHSNINTTMHYTHIQSNSQQNIVNRLNERNKLLYGEF